VIGQSTGSSRQFEPTATSKPLTLFFVADSESTIMGPWNRADRSPPTSARTTDGSPTAKTDPCGRCEESVPTGVTRCPICGYRPAGTSPRLTLLGELGFAALLITAVAVFCIGVGGAILDVPVGPFNQLAIITPYVTGFSGFFTYYLHQKRRLTPVDDQVFG